MPSNNPTVLAPSGKLRIPLNELPPGGKTLHPHVFSHKLRPVLLPGAYEGDTTSGWEQEDAIPMWAAGPQTYLSPCPVCGNKPIVHHITMVVYDSNPSGGERQHDEEFAGRRIYEPSDGGIFIIECPKDCMGLEGTNFESMRHDWNSLPRKAADLANHAPSFVGVYPVGHRHLNVTDGMCRCTSSDVDGLFYCEERNTRNNAPRLATTIPGCRARRDVEAWNYEITLRKPVPA